MAMRAAPVSRASTPGVHRCARVPGTRHHLGSFFPRSRSLMSAPASASTEGAATTAAVDGKYVDRRVVLTREEGKNGDMRQRLEKHGVEVVEMPLIETTVGGDCSELPKALADPNGWDWVCITSPEAAKVFLQGWADAGKPDLPIATVGKGTARVLIPEYKNGALTAKMFTPSKANAETLVKELPVSGDGKPTRILYPASAKAARTLQDGLEARNGNVKVTRLNTYSTEKVTSVERDVMVSAVSADVVTFGSPSAVKAWLALSGLGDTKEQQHPLYACIGGTSAKACDKVGLPGVLFPEQPGVDGWEQIVLEALDSLSEER